MNGTRQHRGFIEFARAYRAARLAALIAKLPRLLCLQHFPAND